MRKLKIGIDVSGLHEMSKTRGIGFYTENLYQALKKYTDNEVTILEKDNVGNGFDIIHFPYFDLFRNTLKLPSNIATVVTIHDVIPLVFPSHYPSGIKGRINLFKQKRALSRVQGVITDSNSSKKDITKYLKVPNEKIHVTHLAQSEQFKEIRDKAVLDEIRLKYVLPDRFAVYIGGVNWNKNLTNTAAACIDNGLDIFFIGKGFETKTQYDHPELKPFKAFLDKYANNPKVHILGFVEEEEMIGILNLATVALQPSFYEGFGLPILEAQSCGVPVITSNVSSMSEIAGDGALLVTPQNPGDIKAAIKSILENSNLRNTLIKKGRENVERFSWRKTAIETNKVYEEISEV